MSKGLLLVFTGNREARTGMALGQVFRSMSRGFHVCFVSFSARSSNDLELDSVLPQKGLLEFHGVSEQNSDGAGEPSNDLAAAKEYWELAKDAISSHRFDLVVLDDIVRAINHSVLNEGEVVAFIRGRAQNQNILITGQTGPSSLIELADIVSEAEQTRNLK
jgi:cob(I)alamin adenosyltransferase